MKAQDSHLNLAGITVRDSDGQAWGLWSLAPALTQHERWRAGIYGMDKTRQDFAWLMPPAGSHGSDLTLALVDVPTATIVRVVR